MAPDRVSAYLEYLPALFAQDPVIDRFLLAFERLLIGTGGADPGDPLPGLEGLETLIDQLPTRFIPMGAEGQAPAEMLPWLATWVGVSLDEGWSEAVRRRFIQQAVPLCRKRGTPAGLAGLLEIYLGRKVEIDDQDPSFPPYYFEVVIRLDNRDPELLAEIDRVARRIIEAEKPAWTSYGLRLQMPGLQLVSQPQAETEGVFIGVTTLLGNV